MILYGIKNCGTVKKAKWWLSQHQQDYRFHDFRSEGVSIELLENWVNRVNWEALLNKSSTSWRQLADDQKADLTQQTAIDLMLAFPTLIKRPVLDNGEKLLLGFKPEWYAAHFVIDRTLDLTDE